MPANYRADHAFRPSYASVFVMSTLCVAIASHEVCQPSDRLRDLRCVLCALKPVGAWAALLPFTAKGSGSTEFVSDMRRYFTKVARMRVEASRSMSREFYAVGLGRKPQGGGKGQGAS